MSSYEAPSEQDIDAPVTAMSSATASPRSCSLNGEHFLSRSISSDCLSLSCTETDMGEYSGDEDETFANMMELPGSDADGARFGKLFSARIANRSELCSIIREDLAKQKELRDQLGQPSPSNAATCCGVRCLPPTHRSLIVGWMRELTRALRLQLSTLFAAVSLLDRFAAAAKIMPSDSELQLLALACVSVAVKYEEVGQVLPQVWLGLAVDPSGRRLYTTQDLQRMEWSLLQTVGWKLHSPSTHSFLENFLLAMPHARGLAAPCRSSSSGAAGWGFGAGTGAGTTPADLSEVLASLTADTSLLRAWPVASSAVSLAEMSLMYDALLPYDYSTIALSCIVLSERMLLPGAAGAACASMPACSPAVGAVSMVAGLPLEQLAVGLESCVHTLDRCCRSYGCGGCA